MCSSGTKEAAVIRVEHRKEGRKEGMYIFLFSKSNSFFLFLSSSSSSSSLGGFVFLCTYDTTNEGDKQSSLHDPVLPFFSFLFSSS